jgi:ABC-type multidrug transport system ATPase subunit
MTVEENLKYFCGLKLMTEKKTNEYIEMMLPKVGMEKKRNQYVQNLSGG